MRAQRPSRRAILRSGLLLGVGAGTQVLAGCSRSDSPPPTTKPTPTATPPDPTPTPTPTPTRGNVQATGRTLMAYFSRPGENYYYGGRRDLKRGNTEVLARMIAELIDCDIYRIEATDPYPDGYDATVAQNVAEQSAETKPAIADPLASIERYDQVLLGSPVWNVRPPMIMSTFTESYDFSGKTVHPFVTHAVSGLGSAERDYATSCAGARISPGLAIQGEEVTQHRDDVRTWLRQNGLVSG